MSCSEAHRVLGWHARTPLIDALTMTVEAMAHAHEHNNGDVRSVAG